jgi:hypothetical protein
MHRTCGGGLRLERRGLTAATALLGPAASSPSVAPASVGAARFVRGVLSSATSLAAAAATAVTAPVPTDVRPSPRSPSYATLVRPLARARCVRRPPPPPKSRTRAGLLGLHMGEGRTGHCLTALTPCARARRCARHTAAQGSRQQSDGAVPGFLAVGVVLGFFSTLDDAAAEVAARLDARLGVALSLGIFSRFGRSQFDQQHGQPRPCRRRKPTAQTRCARSTEKHTCVERWRSERWPRGGGHPRLPVRRRHGHAATRPCGDW